MEIKKDSGWYCWLVVAAILLSMTFIGMATYGSISVLVYIWAEKFNITTDLVVWAPSVMNGTMFLLGPITSLLVQRLGIWKTHLIAGVLLCGGGIATAFATEFWHVIISHSLTEGLAGGIVQLTSIGIVSTYFERHKDKVYAGALAFFFVGVLIGPAMTEQLIKSTDYFYAMIAQGSIFALMIPTALVFRGPQQSKEDDATTSETGKDKHHISIINIVVANESGKTNAAYLPEEPIEQVSTGASINLGDNESETNSSSGEGRDSVDNQSVDLETSESETNSNSGEERDSVDNQSVDLETSESETNSSSGEERDAVNNQSIDLEANHLQTNSKSRNTCDVADNKSVKIEKARSEEKTFMSLIKSHANILRDPVFILFLLYFMFFTVGENTFYALAVDYTVKTTGVLGLHEAALGMTLTGVSAVIGSLIITFVSHWALDRTLIMVVVSMVLSLSLILMPEVETVASVYALFVIFGLMDGAFVAHIGPLVEYQFKDSEGFLTRYAYVLLQIGIGSVSGPLLSAQLGKAVGEIYTFYFLGASSLFAFLILGTYWTVARIRRHRLSKS